MDLNSIVYPAPDPSYTSKNLPSLFYVPYENFPETKLNKIMNFTCVCRESKQCKTPIIEKIPCSFIPYEPGSNKIMLFFHANAEDLGTCQDFMYPIAYSFRVHTIAMEYPGYGIYTNKPTDEARICQDALTVYDFINKNLKYEEKDIIIFGRSLGSGPATHVAARRNPGGLMLMSPFMSIREVVRDFIGDWLQYVVSDRFKNIEEISNVKSPILILHGKDDGLIDSRHAVELAKAAKTKCLLAIGANMTHNKFDFYTDFMSPIETFMREYKLLPDNKFSLQPKFPDESLPQFSETSTLLSNTASTHDLLMLSTLQP